MNTDSLFDSSFLFFPFYFHPKFFPPFLLPVGAFGLLRVVIFRNSQQTPRVNVSDTGRTSPILVVTLPVPVVNAQ